MELKLVYGKQAKLCLLLGKKLTNSFGKKVRCAECGITMMYTRISHSTTKQDGYAYAEYVCKHERLKGCGKKINEDFLKILVFDQIKTLAKLVCDQKEMTRELLKGSKKVGKTLSLERKVNYLKRKLAEIEKTLEQLYIDFSEETVEEEEYKYMHVISGKEKQEN